MSGQPVKRLSSLEIDEVSLVDRPANQHGLVTITKRDEGTSMGVYDEQGRELDETQLQSGDRVYNEQGEMTLLLSDEDLGALLDGELDPAELQLTDDDIEALLSGVDENELVGVGKNAGAAVLGGASTKFKAGTKTASRLLDDVKLGFRHGRGGAAPTTEGNRDARRVGAHFGRNLGAYGAGAGGVAAGEAHGRIKKNAPSLGEEVLSQLSKALTDGDRDGVISKVAERVERAEMIAKRAQERADAIEAEREFEQYVEIGKSFQLPVDEDELGGILQAVSKALTDEQLETFERILNTAAAAVQLDEAGSAGYSPLMGYVDDQALQLVGKSAGDLTPEQATTALFSANDEAYLAYLSENQR